MLYNVLQVCHGGHLLRVLYVRVRTLTNREWEDAKKCRLGGGRMGGRERKQRIKLMAFLFILHSFNASSDLLIIREEKERKGGNY